VKLKTVPGAPTFDAVVNTRLDGVREFKNVREAPSAGMAYDPADYDLMVVAEPGVGYRMVNLPGIIEMDVVNPLASRREEISKRKRM
jgi:hypothetical protein